MYRFDVDYIDEEQGIKHIHCDNGDYVLAEDALALQAKVEELTAAIQKWLDGDYPNPRRNRPHDCMHGVGYWQSCENCETEYWQSVLKQEGEK